MTPTSNNNILLTGGCGFIGSSSLRLLDEGYNTTVVDNLSTGKKDNVDAFLSNENFQFIQLDLLESDKLDEVIRNFDTVIHLERIPMLEKPKLIRKSNLLTAL